MARLLCWDGCVNVRDLGGYEVEAGLRTRFGAVVRSDNPAYLSPAGWGATSMPFGRGSWSPREQPASCARVAFAARAGERRLPDPTPAGGGAVL